ncbi:hypothetical protein JXB28_03720 [Candidatus Woesearchaeota archaeon]|nr:hypothetical protein [Candidatus Woesearchaeota archaeon]
MSNKMQMISKDAVLRIVQQKGPVIPNDIRKEMGGENILISAILSELSQDGKVKISHTKIGGTPAYYSPGTEIRLQNLMKHLNHKDKETAELLMQRKVLKDTDLTPLLRVSLRNIRDFAKPLEVNVRGIKEIYWKWYMLPTPEAEKLIMGSVRPVRKPEIIVQKKPVIVAPVKEEPKKTEPRIIAKPEPRIETKKEEPKKIEKPETKKEEAKKVEKAETQKALGLEADDLEKEKDPYFKKVLQYLKENDIQVIEYKILRRNSEIEMMLIVPSRIGSQEYYCKAKNKKKVNDGELSSTYVQSQAKRLPVIFITTGELTKKAREMLAKDFKGMIVKRI